MNSYYSVHPSLGLGSPSSSAEEYPGPGPVSLYCTSVIVGLSLDWKKQL